MIRAGEPIVLDIGGSLGGYGSDITRTLWVTGGDPARGPDERFRHLYAVLRGAQERPPRPFARGSPARPSTRPRANASPRRATGSASSIGPDTASGWKPTRTRTSSRATTSRWLSGMHSASNRASISTASTARASRTSSCAVLTVPTCSTRRRVTCTWSPGKIGTCVRSLDAASSRSTSGKSPIWSPATSG